MRYSLNISLLDLLPRNYICDYISHLQKGEQVLQREVLPHRRTLQVSLVAFSIEDKCGLQSCKYGDKRFLILHSDGVGRSGTYVLIDMVLNRMTKGCKEIDIAATLEHIRDQRGGMVQTRQQFEFCLTAVAEEVHAILKALPTTTAQ